jgi:hypothetical protein
MHRAHAKARIDLHSSFVRSPITALFAVAIGAFALGLQSKQTATQLLHPFFATERGISFASTQNMPRVRWRRAGRGECASHGAVRSLWGAKLAESAIWHRTVRTLPEAPLRSARYRLPKSWPLCGDHSHGKSRRYRNAVMRTATRKLLGGRGLYFMRRITK